MAACRLCCAAGACIIASLPCCTLPVSLGMHRVITDHGSGIDPLGSCSALALGARSCVTRQSPVAVCRGRKRHLSGPPGDNLPCAALGACLLYLSRPISASDKTHDSK